MEAAARKPPPRPQRLPGHVHRRSKPPPAPPLSPFSLPPLPWFSLFLTYLSLIFAAYRSRPWSRSHGAACVTGRRRSRCRVLHHRIELIRTNSSFPALDPCAASISNLPESPLTEPAAAFCSSGTSSSCSIQLRPSSGPRPPCPAPVPVLLCTGPAKPARAAFSTNPRSPSLLVRWRLPGDGPTG